MSVNLQSEYTPTIGQNVAITLVARVLQFILSFTTGVIIARAIGPSGKGIYSLVVLTYSLAVLLAGVGIPTANTCFVGQKKDKIPNLVSNSVIVVIGAAFSLAVVFAIFSLWHIFDQVTLKYIALAFVLAPFGLLTELFSGIIWGQNRIREFNLVTVARPLSILILIVLFFITFGLNLKGVLASWGISQIIVVILATWILLRRTSLSLSPDLRLMKESLGFGSQIWLMNIIGTLNFRFDIFLVAYFLSPKEVGYYSVAVVISGLLFYIPTAIAVALLPRLTSANPKEASRIASKGCRTALFSSVILSLFLLATARFLIPAVYGKAFLPSVMPLLLLLPGVAVYGMAHITTSYFNGYLSKPFINAGVAGLSLIIDVALNIVLIPKMGVIGAALASSISYITAMGVCVYIFTRMSRTSIRNMIVVRPTDLQSYLGLARTFVGRMNMIRG